MLMSGLPLSLLKVHYRYYHYHFTFIINLITVVAILTINPLVPRGENNKKPRTSFFANFNWLEAIADFDTHYCEL